VFPVMFGVMLEDVVATSAPALAAMAPPTTTPASQISPITQAQPCRSSANGRSTAMVTRSVVSHRENEKGDHPGRLPGDPAKSPITRGAPRAFTCSLHRAD
jgi:hypothetical protein